jgi:hypothetical protein
LLKPIRALVVLAFVLSLAACGGDDPSESAHKELTGAAAALRKAKTATVHFDAKLYNTTGNDAAQWAGTSKVKYGDPDATDTEFSRASVDVPNLAFKPGQPLSEQHDLDLREISVGQVRYQRSSKLRLPAGKTWVKLAEGSDLQFNARVANPDLVVDPHPYLKILEGVSASFALTSDTRRTETLDGAETRIYQADCELGSEDCGDAALPTALRTMFPGKNTLSMKVWLDNDGRPRKLVVEADLDSGASDVALGGNKFYKLKATMTFTGFGGPVTISEPPASQTTTDYTVVL